jgi:hypothetical protein
LNQAFQSKGFQGFAQMADMNIDGTFFYVDCFIPDRLNLAGAAVYCFRVGHEKLQQAKFRGSQADQMALTLIRRVTESRRNPVLSMEFKGGLAFARRNSAAMRATSSRGEKGLVI